MNACEPNWREVTVHGRELRVSDTGVVIRLPFDVMTPTGGAGRKKAIVLKPHLTVTGYHRISVADQLVMVHRVVALAFIGPIGTLDVDHINHDRTDNRLSNLRIVSRSVNARNRKGANKNNRSGHRGVYWHPRQKAWISQGPDGRYLGAYRTVAEAAACSIAARQ